MTRSCPVLRAKARVWVERNGQPLLGKGRTALLLAIGQTGSISAAARAIGLSYRAAWNWVEEMNRRAPLPLVAKATGGRGGGGARLTKAGLAAIQAFQSLSGRIDRLCQQASRQLQGLFD